MKWKDNQMEHIGYASLSLGDTGNYIADSDQTLLNSLYHDKVKSYLFTFYYVKAFVEYRTIGTRLGKYISTVLIYH